MRTKIFFLLFVVLFPSFALAQEGLNITYAAEIDGMVSFAKGTVTLSILDYENNGSNLDYVLSRNNGIGYLSVKKDKLLMLYSDALIYMLGPSGKYLFNGISASGKLVEFINPATSYRASSELKEGKVTYSVNNLAYLKSDKPWAEGVSGGGVGQTIDMQWKENIFALVIINGFISYQKPFLFTENNRVKKIRLYTTNSKKYSEYELADTPDPQIILLDEESAKARIEISSIYKGTKWDDTCISMIQGINALSRDELLGKRGLVFIRPLSPSP